MKCLWCVQRVYCIVSVLRIACITRAARVMCTTCITCICMRPIMQYKHIAEATSTQNEYNTYVCLSGTFLVVQPVHLRQHTRAARAHKSANMASASTLSVLPRKTGPARGHRGGAERRGALPVHGGRRRGRHRRAAILASRASLAVSRDAFRRRFCFKGVTGETGRVQVKSTEGNLASHPDHPRTDPPPWRAPWVSPCAAYRIAGGEELVVCASLGSSPAPENSDPNSA